MSQKFTSQEKNYNYVWWQMLNRLIEVITWQYIQILNHYVVHMKLYIYYTYENVYMSIIYEFFKKWESLYLSPISSLPIKVNTVYCLPFSQRLSFSIFSYFQQTYLNLGDIYVLMVSLRPCGLPSSWDLWCMTMISILQS